MVGKTCSVCRRCSYIERQLSFFSYPSDPKRRHQWLEAVNRMDLKNKLDNFKTRGNHRICEVHFEKKYVKRSHLREGRKFLTKDAVPTLCLDLSQCIAPMTLENLRTAPKFARNIIWREYHAATQAIEVKQTSLTIHQVDNQTYPERRSVRQAMALKNKIHYKNKLRSHHQLNIINSPPSSPSLASSQSSARSQRSASSSSLPPYEDMSQFCESVIRVSKGTQTFVSENNKRKIVIPQLNINKINADEAVKIDKESFLQMCSKFLPSSLFKVVEWSLSSARSRQNINYTLFAINLYYSCNLYNFLKDMLTLPSKEDLKYFLLPKSTKLNENFIKAFRCKVNNMSTKKRICSFSVGTILLKPHLYYDITHDRIIGLHDVNGEQNTCVAKYAVLLMVQGILENWSQPVAYAFISEYDNFPEISTWIDEVLTTLIDVGLDVKVFVSDPRSEFLYVSESRTVSPDKTYFAINGTDIFHTYDTAQLFKIVKNNLKSCDFDYGSYSKISNNDDFFKQLNYLCKMLNSKTQFAESPYSRAFSNKKYQREFLNEMLHVFRNLKVVRKVDGADVTENMKFVEDFQITINSVLQLFDELHFLGVKYLLTSRLNHNSINRFFTKTKLINSNEECTPRQFNKSFVRSFVYNMLKKQKGDNSIDNSLDSEEFCQQLLDEEYKETPNQLQTSQPLLVNTTDYRVGLPDKNCFVYVCGYCYLKCVQRHSCDAFTAYLNDYQVQQKDGLTYLCSVSLDLNLENCAMMPPEDFTEYLMLLENKFKEYIKSDVMPLYNIGHEILREFDKYEFGMPCPCFPIDYLKALFIRVRLFYTIRKNNKLLKRRMGVNMVKVYSL